MMAAYVAAPSTSQCTSVALLGASPVVDWAILASSVQSASGGQTLL